MLTIFFLCTEVILLLGYTLFAFILFWGGGPHRGILGFHYWKHPFTAGRTYLEGGDAGRFVALLQCVVLSAFAFIFAPELVIVAAGEMESPRRNIPRASRRFFYRLIFFYIIGILAVTVLCPSTDKALTDGGSGVASSPFVIGIKNASVCTKLCKLSCRSEANGALLLSP